MKHATEDVVLEYFQQQPLAAAELMLKLCTKAVKRRQVVVAKPKLPLKARREVGQGLVPPPVNDHKVVVDSKVPKDNVIGR